MSFSFLDDSLKREYDRLHLNNFADLDEMYADFSELVCRIPSHRILAINRGEKEEVLKVKIDKNEDKILYNLEKSIIKGQTQS